MAEVRAWRRCRRLGQGPGLRRSASAPMLPVPLPLAHSR
jgi:hypothetical protein